MSRRLIFCSSENLEYCNQKQGKKGVLFTCQFLNAELEVLLLCPERMQQQRKKNIGETREVGIQEDEVSGNTMCKQDTTYR